MFGFLDSMSPLVKHSEFKMAVRVLSAFSGYVILKAPDGQILSMDHAKGLAENKEEVRPARIEIAHPIQVFDGPFDLVTVAQGARGVHQGSDIIGIFGRRFGEKAYRVVKPVCDPQRPRTS